jgi:YegS/Rv2252/BmrU family lipid kinase
MAESRIVFIVNPRSAAGATLRRFEQYRRRVTELMANKGHIVDVCLTEAPRHATRFARDAVRAGATAVIAVGGDGTNNEVINGFFDDDGTRLPGDTAFGVVTSGTGGDFRRTLGWGAEPLRDIERIANLQRRRIDVGRIWCTDADGREVSRYFLNESSFGLSGDVVDHANRSSKKLGAQLSFFKAAVKAAVVYEPKKVELCIDGGPATIEDISFVAISNGQYFGGSMKVAPNASLDDGRFDTVVTHGGLGFWLKNIAGLYSGRYIDVDGVRVVRNQTLSARAINAAERVPIEVDGEAPGFLPARWQLVPAAVDLLV